MDRRSFLRTAMIGAAALRATQLESASFAEERPDPPPPHPRKNWVWITLNPDRSVDAWKRLFATMRANNIHAILPEMYDGRHAYFRSRHLPVQTDLLGRLLPLARAEDLEVHAWMWTMPCMVPEIIAKHPDWYNVNARGESAVDKPAYVDYYKFLDPGCPEVREWVQTTVKELASIPDLTGVHLDYVRHPDAILPKGLWSKYNIVQDKVYPPYDYGYSNYERALFKKQFNVDPIDIGTGKIKDPTLEKAWFQFRLDMVVDLVNDYLVPAAHGKGKRITAAVFPGPSLAREMVRQDWGRFQLDAFLPMLYHVFYDEGPEWVRTQTREGVSAVTQPLYSGLFIHDMKAEEFTRTVQMALEGGASGVSLFSADAMDLAKWQVLRKL
ncbi:MAG: family 10 glycosylhydrolase [Terriglobales bacterium]